MSRYNKDLGDFGEAAAAAHLEKSGMTVKERNFRTRGGEIDIVADDGDVLVFVEVKTRSSDKFGCPSEAVDIRKIEHMKAAAEQYFLLHPTDGEIRFDVVEVRAARFDGIPRLININHIKDILN